MSDPKETSGRIFSLFKKIQKHKGKEISDLVSALGQTEYILERNFSELQLAIQYYENNFLTLWNRDNRLQMIGFVREFARVFHNYLSSVYTLIGHTRVFLKHLGNQTFNSEYEKRKQDLLNNNVIAFTKDLRDYGQHYGMSMFAASLQLEKVTNFEPSLTMNLQKKELLKWDGWTQQAKAYLSKQPDGIDIKIVTNEYQLDIRKFYEWFHRRLSELYSSEIAEYIETLKEFHAVSGQSTA
jgi:hypothetical protein